MASQPSGGTHKGEIFGEQWAVSLWPCSPQIKLMNFLDIALVQNTALAGKRIPTPREHLY